MLLLGPLCPPSFVRGGPAGPCCSSSPLQYGAGDLNIGEDMTRPSPETIERERDKLFVTDAELIRWLGVPEEVARPVIQRLEERAGFPRKQKLWGDRRYKPAVRAFLDKMNGIIGEGVAKRRSAVNE